MPLPRRSKRWRKCSRVKMMKMTTLTPHRGCQARQAPTRHKRIQKLSSLRPAAPPRRKKKSARSWSSDSSAWRSCSSRKKWQPLSTRMSSWKWRRVKNAAKKKRNAKSSKPRRKRQRWWREINSKLRKNRKLQHRSPRNGVILSMSRSPRSAMVSA